jgi:predicted AAA+ superfamily ATPase
MAKEFSREIVKVLEKRILEKRKFIQVVAGPRQVGKTTAIKQLLAKNLIFAKRYSVDTLNAAGGNWIDTIWEEMRAEMTERGETEGLLVIDEIQKIQNWSEYVKKNWDEDSWNDLGLKVIILGSSRLLLQRGLSESLMGRFELNYVGHWSYQEMRAAFGVTPEQYAWFGGYPGAAEYITQGDEQRFKDYVSNAIVEASLNNDVMSLTDIRKPVLLKRLFEFATSYSSQILSYNKILGQLNEPGNTSTLSHYLRLLDQAGLVVGLDTYSKKLVKTRAASPKFQAHNTALISSGQQTQTFQDAVTDPVYWGRVVESVVGAHLLAEVNRQHNIKLFYWRDGSDEMDFVLQSGDEIVGIEVKSKVSERVPRNIAIFQERFPEAKTMLVGSDGMDWKKFITMSGEDIFRFVGYRQNIKRKVE